jgi:alkylation response protein AidB-like acyl-CoA dehydrogenase
MNLHPTDEQAMLADSIGRFARDHAGASPDALMAGLAGLGLLALPVPEAAGGLGGDGLDLMGMMQAVGRALLPVPLAGTVAALDLLGHHGTPAQQARWLAPAVEGAARLAFARLDAGPGDRLTGLAPLVPGADRADALVLIAGGGAVIVATDAPGVQLDPLRMADGIMGARVTLTGAAADPLAATPDQVTDSLARTTAALAAQRLGIMDRLLADTLDYVKTRQQFGTAIGSFQTIQHRMARLFTETELCRSLVIAAADRNGPRADWLGHVAAAQAMTAEQGLHLAQECVQFHGGMGITDDLAVSRGHRQMMVLTRLPERRTM